jgi:flavorubredoxin
LDCWDYSLLLNLIFCPGFITFTFGCYGWHAESIRILDEILKKAGFEIITEGLKISWNPDDSGIQNCIEYGKSFVEKLK